MEMIKQDITKETSGIVIHGVNAQGAMGSGVAAYIRSAWPKVFHSYISFLTKHGSKGSLGKVDFCRISDNLYVGNCFTQEFFGGDGKRYANIEYVESCLVEVFEFAKKNSLEIKSPMIGSGLGGLSWENEVKPLFESINKKYNLTVKIFYI
jgi:O-acetyl-ADP-ribose deacetylase (regulator of RNase III)